MNLLDSDHLSVLTHPTSPRAVALRARLTAGGEPPATTIVSVEEAMRGWLASIAREREPARQVSAYRQLGELFGFFAGMQIALFTDAAAAEFARLRAAKVRIATTDLKIAAITLTQGGLLLTANRRDFEQVPGLHFENWLAP